MIACVGGGSNAIGTFVAFLEDEGVELIGVEAAGEGLETGRHGARLTTNARGVLHGSMSAVLQDEEGQILEAHSISAGLDYPGSGPEHAQLRDTGRATYVAITDSQAVEAFKRVCPARGDHPRARAVPRSRMGVCQPRRRPRACDAVRAVATRTSTRCSRLADRIAAAFASHGRRAALMPYLMGGFPDLEASRAVGEACIDAGADLLELGIPFSDPLSDGPVIHAAATQALAAGATLDGVLGVCETLAARVPVVLMVYANTVLARGPEAFAERAAVAGAAGLIVPDLPHDEATTCAPSATSTGLRWSRSWRRTRRRTASPRSAADARGFVYAVSLTGTTGERSALSPELGQMVERVRRPPACPWRSGSASPPVSRREASPRSRTG